MVILEMLGLVFFGMVLTLFVESVTRGYRKRKLMEKLPSFVPAVGGCSGGHGWVKVPLTHQNLEGEQIGGGLSKVCRKCGFLGDGTDRMVNAPGLEQVGEFLRQEEESLSLNKEVERRLQFDSGIYFDAWIVKHRTVLKELLSAPARVEELHTLLHNFLVRGSLAMQDLQDRIVREILEERKRGGDELEIGLTNDEKAV